MKNKKLESGVRQTQMWSPALPLLSCHATLDRLLIILFSSRMGKIVAPAPACCEAGSNKMCAAHTHSFPVHLLSTYYVLGGKSSIVF